jgi:hypothetical protein
VVVIVTRRLTLDKPATFFESIQKLALNVVGLKRHGSNPLCTGTGGLFGAGFNTVKRVRCTFRRRA